MRLLKKKVVEKAEEVIEDTEVNVSTKKKGGRKPKEPHESIKIDETYFLTVQPYNIVLMTTRPKGDIPEQFKSKVKANDEVTTKEEVYGYYSTVAQALHGYLDARMNDAVKSKEVNDINSLFDLVQNIRNDIDKFKEEFRQQDSFPFKAPK